MTSYAFKKRMHDVLLGAPVALLFSFIFISASGLSFTWLILILAGLGFVTLTFLSRRPQDIYFTCYIATVSVELTKGLIAEGGIYTPGLYLSLSDLFLIPLLVSKVLNHLFERRPPVRSHPILTAASIWLLWQWISALNSMVSLGAILAAVNQTKYFIALWVVASYLGEPKHWQYFMRGIAIAVVLHFIMSMLQVGTGGGLQLQGIKTSAQQTISYAAAGLVGLFRPSGLLSHPNALADFLVLILPTVAGFLLLGRGKIGPAFLSVIWVLLLGLLMLVLTLSRGGWVAFVIGMICFIVLGFRRHIISILHIRRMLICVIIGLMVTAVAFPTVYLRLTESDNRSTQSRILLAQQALLIIERYPVSGVGLGAYTYAAHRNLPTTYSSIPDAFRESLLKGVVHNKYLLVAAETGLIGLLLFLNIFRVAFKFLWRARFNNDPVRQALAVGFFAGLVAGLSTFMLEHANIGVPVETTWIMLGACIPLIKKSRPYTAAQLQAYSTEARDVVR